MSAHQMTPIIQGAIDEASAERTKPLVDALRAADAHLMNVPVRPGICKVSQQIDAALAPFEEEDDAKK